MGADGIKSHGPVSWPKNGYVIAVGMRESELPSAPSAIASSLPPSLPPSCIARARMFDQEPSIADVHRPIGSLKELLE
ncbi:uncharacterized protein FIBRA_06172 [Fibroporia radiculosa]|uniref:Uncharacterized protein n=1 Tax=Fibroporia radiculosa TaxID=599839 RepID=J4GSA4_9APHY|nr:uncharacterized protein FIBRA_06172 [Fibroporia radiculosa]CCM04015.1 predicted protein [Fibroporia radiculosa]